MEHSNSLNLLVRLEEYSRRLYEEENDRSLRLNGGAKNLFLILGATVAFLGAVIQWFLPNPTIHLSNAASWVIAVLLAIGFLLATACFILILMALRVRTFERQCDPIDLAGRSIFLQSEDELLSEIISNQLVASGRNFLVNENKAAMLSRAYYCYFFSTASVILAALVGVTLNFGGP